MILCFVIILNEVCIQATLPNKSLFNLASMHYKNCQKYNMEGNRVLVRVHPFTKPSTEEGKDNRLNVNLEKV